MGMPDYMQIGNWSSFQVVGFATHYVTNSVCEYVFGFFFCTLHKRKPIFEEWFQRHYLYQICQVSSFSSGGVFTQFWW